MNEAPEVETKTEWKQDLPVYVLTCKAPYCKWIEETEDVVYSDELRITHQQWHEDGMPE